MLLKSLVIVAGLLMTPNLMAQENSPVRTEVGMDPTLKKYVEVEQQLSACLGKR